MGDAAPPKNKPTTGLGFNYGEIQEGGRKIKLKQAFFIIQNEPKTKKMFPSMKEQEKAANMLLRFMMGLIIRGT